MKSFLKVVGRHSVDVALGGILLLCIGLGVVGDLLRMAMRTAPPDTPKAKRLHDEMGKRALEWWLSERAQAADSAARLDAFQTAAEEYLEAASICEVSITLEVPVRAARAAQPQQYKPVSACP